MGYLVLARKLRPMRFADLVGQETVARALTNAVQTNRVAHAFLFAGSRGVGKTSAARILTKALNCEQLQEGEPCNVCPQCVEITQNASPDVLEIDAASNRGIDNIRDLRANTSYGPVRGRYKTYIIDEVHMLTMESFNALLKTLEEPPGNVIFILATTNPHKIPDTILSRCQRFDFLRIPVKKMTDYLARVTAEEGLTFSEEALGLIARNAAGGMRDALTMVDQVVSYAGVSPGDEQVSGVLGVLDNREVLSLLGAVLEKSVEEALKVFGDIIIRGHDLDVLLEDLLREVKDFSLFRAMKKQGPHFQDHTPATLEWYAAFKEKVNLDVLQQIFYVLLELERQLRFSESPRACFEMALLKACDVESLVGVPDLLNSVRNLLKGTPGSEGSGGGTRLPSGIPHARGREQSTTGSPPLQSGEKEDEPGPGGMRVSPNQTTPPLPTVPVAPASPDAPAEISSPGENQGESLAPQTIQTPQTTPAPAPKNSLKARAAKLQANASASSLPPSERGAGQVEKEKGGASIQEQPKKNPDKQPENETKGMADDLDGPPPAPPMEAYGGLSSSPPDLKGDANPSPSHLSPPPPSSSPSPPQSHPLGPSEAVASTSKGENKRTPFPAGTQGKREEQGQRQGAQEPEEVELPPENPFCADARWGNFLEALRPTAPRLVAELRQVEVEAISENEVVLLPPGRGMNLDGAELEKHGGILTEVFGPSFHLRVNHDTKKISRPGYSLGGWEQLKKKVQEAKAREKASQDEAVTQVLGYFPNGKIEKIHIQPDSEKVK